MEKGLFMVLDSGEGAGKTTVLTRLKELFKDNLVLTREPGGSPYAEKIRDLILDSPYAKQADARTMFGLFWAARADHLKNIVIPALEAGKMVISDRFDSSTFAYQIVAQGARDLEDLFWAMRRLYLGEFQPDLYIYLDIDPLIGLSRKNSQGGKNHFDERKMEFHKKLRIGFKEFMTEINSVVIDASMSKDEVFRNVLSLIEERLVK